MCHRTQERSSRAKGQIIPRPFCRAESITEAVDLLPQNGRMPKLGGLATFIGTILDTEKPLRDADGVEFFFFTSDR